MTHVRGGIAGDLLAPAKWQVSRRWAWAFGLVPAALPLIGGVLAIATGVRLFWWFGPLFAFVLVPALDRTLGKNAENPLNEAVPGLEADPFYRRLLDLFVPIHYAGLVFACVQWSLGGLTFVDCLGLATTVGVASGAAINAAHELGHKTSRLEQLLAKLALAPSFYGHFTTEHNRGHHVNVATPADPASSRLGESFWAFLPRTLSGSLKESWALESARLRRGGRPALSPANALLQGWTLSAALFAALAGFFGPAILPWLTIQAVVGFSLLEAVNYIEHYGLLRRPGAEGRLERCLPEHSWNSNEIASNLLLYHLQRHSDHHARPMRRYQALQSCPDAPELPSGYGTMLVVAAISPLWRYIMDKRVLAHYGGDASRANVAPGSRARFGL